MRKRNHAYKPKPLVPTLGFAYTKEHALQLKLMPHTALEALRTGAATEDDISTIIVRLDWGVILIKNHFDQEQAGRVMNDGLNMQDTTTRREQWLALNQVQRICARL